MDLSQLLRALGLQQAYQSYQQNIGQPFANVAGPFGRGLLGLDRPEYGEEQAYRTGQAMGNMPAVSAPVGAFKAAAQIPGILEALPLLAGMSYRVSTPLKVDPSVGTRFEREFIGGLAEKTPINAETLKDASVMIMPWDASSRNYKITNVSDVPLASNVVTHGGQDYARDLAHIQEGIAGASNLGIAKRIADRDAIARQENIAAGGSGRVIHLPVTMGEYAENFSVMPVGVFTNILDAIKLKKKDVAAFDDMVRAYVPEGAKAGEKPFVNFAGIMTEKGRQQLLTGEDLADTAGELRKAVMNRARMKTNQERFGFNIEDITSAIIDPSLVGVPKGYVGNTVIESTGPMRLTQSRNPTYDTNFSGNYIGTLGASLPVEVLMPKRFAELSQEFSSKKLSPTGVRTATLGALEKRKQNVSEFVDDQVIENILRYLSQQQVGR